MIDRGARKAVAEAIRYYLSGSSTNFTLDEKLFGLKSRDAAIDAIRKQLWLIYDDLREHRHEGAWTISADQREIIIRIILFLKSDFEFQWPSVPSWYRITSAFIWLVTFGFGSRALDRRFEFQDTDNVWPFHSSEEVQVAKNDPKYLAAAK